MISGLASLLQFDTRHFQITYFCSPIQHLVSLIGVQLWHDFSISEIPAGENPKRVHLVSALVGIQIVIMRNIWVFIKAWAWIFQKTCMYTGLSSLMLLPWDSRIFRSRFVWSFVCRLWSLHFSPNLTHFHLKFVTWQPWCTFNVL